jgi:hypothetical protein
MEHKRLWDIMQEREPIEGNPLCCYHTREPLSLSVAEIVSKFNEGLIISMPNSERPLGYEHICCIYPSYHEGGDHWSDFQGYPSWKEEKIGLKTKGGAIIGRIGDPFFYRITEEQFKKGLLRNKRQRLRIDRVRRPLVWYDNSGRLIGNWFLWNDNYFNFVRNVFEGLSDVSMKKYGEPSVLVDAPVVFDDLDEICTLERARKDLWGK